MRRPRVRQRGERRDGGRRTQRRPSRAPGHSSLAAEGPEEVREGAEPGEDESEVEARVGRNWNTRDLRVVELLKLHLQAAALRHVVHLSALALDVASADVPAERVAAGGSAVEPAPRAVRGEVIVGRTGW